MSGPVESNQEAAPEADASTGDALKSKPDQDTQSQPEKPDAAFSQVIAALNVWVTGLSGISDPPFHRDAAFPDSEWTHFFRLLAVSTALAGASALAQNIAPTVFQPSMDGRSLAVLTVFACFGVIYNIYSRFFGIRITVRQSIFCFALVGTPWFPFFILLKTAGPNLGVDWFILLAGLCLYVFVLLVRAIRIVTGAGSVRIVFSLLLGVALAGLAIWPVPGLPSPQQTPAAPVNSQARPATPTSNTPTAPPPATEH